jgi:hypothetical protein
MTLAVFLLYNEFMNSDEFIKFGNGYVSLTLSDFGKESFPHISLADYGFRNGEKNAIQYSEDELIEILKSRDYEDIYKAFGAISKRKLRMALSHLKNMALYDEDQEIQTEAIRTIRRIGGKKAFDILRFLKTTEHKEFVQQMLDLKYLEDIDAC